MDGANIKENAMRGLGPVPEFTPTRELALLIEEAQQKAKKDAEDITKPLILDFYRLRTDPKATLAQIAERIEKQFPQGFTGCFKVTIERN